MEKELMTYFMMASLTRARQSGAIADQLESFVMAFPDKELRRKSRWIIQRLRNIDERAD